MHTSRRLAVGAVLFLAVAGSAAACGKSGSSGTAAPPSNVATGGCAGVADSKLVVLTDDKKLQTVDNIIPAVNKSAATPELLAALGKVSAALDTQKLIALNKATDVDHKTPVVAAQDFAQQANLTSGITKGPGGKIVIGTANFSENQTVGELYKIALTAAGYNASTQTVGNREAYEPALEKGTDIQVVPEYAGTLTEFLNTKVNGANATPLASSDLDKTVTALKGVGDKVGLAFGDPSPAADQNAFAVTKATADKYSLKTLSDFASKCSGKDTVLAGPEECPNRPFCQPGLEKTYGMQFGKFVKTDPGGPLTKRQLTEGSVTIGLVFSSDAALAP
jgi:osmoprotectant transport system substrate-binding protein